MPDLKLPVNVSSSLTTSVIQMTMNFLVTCGNQGSDYLKSTEKAVFYQGTSLQRIRGLEMLGVFPSLAMRISVEFESLSLHHYRSVKPSAPVGRLGSDTPLEFGRICYGLGNWVFTPINRVRVSVRLPIQSEDVWDHVNSKATV